jgi:hypothetical protein
MQATSDEALIGRIAAGDKARDAPVVRAAIIPALR